MIREHALLPVITGREADFERAFERARPIVSGMPGFRDISLSRSIESPSTYLLLVEWDRLEDHTVGFRESADYQRWKDLLHHFYDPFRSLSTSRPFHRPTASRQTLLSNRSSGFSPTMEIASVSISRSKRRRSFGFRHHASSMRSSEAI